MPPTNPRRSHYRALGPSGFHRVSYVEWGAPDAKDVAICVHGLTRRAGDFDALAAVLAARRRVICPDVVGRGDSDWLAVKAQYGYPLYVSDMAALIARTGADSVDWIGTSMGGMIGMLLAAQPNSPVRRLVLNDVGPFLPKASVERIAAYLGFYRKNQPVFADIPAVESYLRQVHAPFGPLTDEQWRAMAEGDARPAEGGYVLHYDPGIADPIVAIEPADIDLWAVWEAVSCPVLVIRGRHSDLLTKDIAARMAKAGPRVEVFEVADAGHAPALLDPAQIEAIRGWLDR